MGNTILLTGGAGYIGSHTFSALVQAGFDVVILDDFSNAQATVIDRLAQITGRDVTCYTGSVLDPVMLDQIFASHAIDAVVHFAARKAVGESVAQPLDYFDTNISGLLTLLQAMKRAGVWRLVFSSSAAVYGVPDIVPTPETAPCRHENPYGFTKITGELILQQAAGADPFAFGILRYFNPAGAHPSGLIGEDPNGVPNNLMPFVAQVAVGQRTHINVFGNDYPTRDGTGERDYIHVMDLARGHVMSLQSLIDTNKGHLVNLGTGVAYSVLDMIAAYGRVVGRDLPYELAPRRAGDVPIYLADVTRARDILGFETEFDLMDMCQSSWQWINRGIQGGAT